MYDATARERRWSILVIGAALVVFVALIIAVPALFMSFDEAKYLGIGRNVLAGQGPRIVFGGYFLPHSPLWSAVLYAPQAWFGIDALSWGHALNAIAGAGVLALTGAIGWRIRPAVGALAVVAYLAVTYLQDLTRTARLDVPAAALILLYVLIGFRAVRSGSIRWSIAAGASLAVAFLVKEIALPFAPLPLLVGIVSGRPWRSLAKVSGWLVIAAAVGMSWWFLFVAQVAHVVYRLGTPAWTLLPITIGLAVAAIIGISAERLAGRSSRAVAGGSSPAAAGASSPAAAGASRRRIAIAWILAVAWAVALTIFFARTLGLRATALIDPIQIAHYVRTWLSSLIGVVVIVVIGLPLCLAAWRTARSRGEDPVAYHEVWLALVCGAPLVLLVVGIGEPPRNYLAQIGIAAVVSAAGWLWALTRAAQSIALRRPDLVSRVSRRLPARLVLPTLLVVGLVFASTVLGAHTLRYRQSQTGSIRNEAIQTVQAWMRQNVAPGTTVAFGSLLSYEMALGLPDGARAVTIHQELSRIDAGSPEGMVAEGGSPTADWVSVDIAPRNVNEFQAYRTSTLEAQFRRYGAKLWVYTIGTTTAAPTILSAIPTATGIHEIAQWRWTSGKAFVETHILAVDPATVAFDPSHLYMAPDALDRLLTGLEKDPAQARSAAAEILARLTVTGPADVVQPLLDRLRRLAGS